MATKKVHAIAAIDADGNWIIYGFAEMESVGDLHQSGVTEELADPVAYYRITAELVVPEPSALEEVEAKVEKVDA